VLPPDQYVASLARKRMAATAFFRDDQGRVLLVNPVYKGTWDLPGGAVEAEESPHAACRREVEPARPTRTYWEQRDIAVPDLRWAQVGERMRAAGGNPGPNRSRTAHRQLFARQSAVKYNGSAVNVL
jgi:hypothetical protein